MKKVRPALILIFCAVMVLVIMIISLCVGASGMSISQLLKAIIAGINESAASRIFWFVRLPRTAAAVLAGAGLASAGAIVQIVLSNHLASPGIIGVNAGAGLAVTICTALGVVSGWLQAGSAFAGALIATFLVVAAAKKSGASKTTVVLGGIAVSACISAFSEAIAAMVPDAAIAHADFRIGGFSSVNPDRLIPAGIFIILGILAACTIGNDLDVLSLGDDTASSLGLSVNKIRNLALVLAALLAGASVSFAGLLGFVGLIIPHIGRKFVGSSSTVLIPFSALFGAAFVALCDLLSRAIFSPYELPTGILLSILGGPFFVWLLFKRKEAHK